MFRKTNILVLCLLILCASASNPTRRAKNAWYSYQTRWTGCEKGIWNVMDILNVLFFLRIRGVFTHPKKNNGSRHGRHLPACINKHFQVDLRSFNSLPIDISQIYIKYFLVSDQLHEWRRRDKNRIGKLLSKFKF